METLKYDATVLQKMDIIKSIEVEGWIDDSYVKQAFRELGRDYAKESAVITAGTSPGGVAGTS